MGGTRSLDGSPTSFYAKLSFAKKQGFMAAEREGHELVIQNEVADTKNELEVLKVEEWKSYEWLFHGFSTRHGGISKVYGGSALALEAVPDEVNTPLTAVTKRPSYVFASLPSGLFRASLKTKRQSLVVPISEARVAGLYARAVAHEL